MLGKTPRSQTVNLSKRLNPFPNDNFRLFQTEKVSRQQFQF